MDQRFQMFYPWQEMTVQSPWGVIRARRAGEQARHGKGDPRGGQFASEDTASNPEHPRDVGVIKGRFKEYNRLRVQLAKAKKRAKDKFGSDDPADYDERTRSKLDGLHQATIAAKMRFDRSRRRAAGSGIQINALGKWTNSEPDARLLKEAAGVRGKLAEAKRKFEKEISENPEIVANKAIVKENEKIMAEEWGRVAELHSVAVDQGYPWEIEDWPDTDEANELKAEYLRAQMLGMDAETRLRDAGMRVTELRGAAREKHFSEIKEMLKPDDPMSVQMTFREGAENLEGIHESMVEAASFVSWEVSPSREIIDGKPYPMTVPVVGLPEGERSYFRDGWLYMGNGGQRSVAHELGHYLSHYNKGVKYKANQFLKDRTIGEEPTPIKGKRDEVGYEDDFQEHYAGKLYLDGEGARPYQMNSTEIVSKGLEYMATDPMAFAETDPEYFDFIYAILRGG